MTIHSNVLKVLNRKEGKGMMIELNWIKLKQD